MCKIAVSVRPVTRKTTLQLAVHKSKKKNGQKLRTLIVTLYSQTQIVQKTTLFLEVLGEYRKC